MTARRLRAAFLGKDATSILDQLAKTPDGDIASAGGRWLFRASRPSPVASGEWSRGIDVVVLGAMVGAPLPGVNSVRAPPRHALLQAAAAGVPRIVIVARDDADELAHRAMCSELGLEGDEAIVVRTDQIDDVAEVVDAMDRVAIAPPPGDVLGGVVATARGPEVDLFGTMLRGTFALKAQVHVLAGDEWIPCSIERITRRPRESYGVAEPQLASVSVGDQVSLFLRAQRDVSALDARRTRFDRLLETLVVDEPLPLVSAVSRGDSLEPLENPPNELRVFLGWNVAVARVVKDTLQFATLQPAPPTGRYFVLP